MNRGLVTHHLMTWDTREQDANMSAPESLACYGTVFLNSLSISTASRSGTRRHVVPKGSQRARFEEGWAGTSPREPPDSELDTQGRPKQGLGAA